MKSVIQKINKVMEEVGAIEKDGRNDFHNYAYLSHAGIMKKLQPALVKAGLVIYPSDICLLSSDNQRVITKQEYTVTDGENSIKIYGIGEGIDKGDKASYKAQTGGHKYALKALLTLPDENDAEGDTSTDKLASKAKKGDW